MAILRRVEAILANPRTQKLVSTTFYVLLAIFLVIYLRRLDWHTLLQARVIVWPLLISAVLEVVSRYWGIGVWLAILRSLGAQNLRVNLLGLMFAYSKAWLGRYIPGTAPWILGKIYFASKYGINKHRLAVASLMEGALEAGSVLTLGLCMLLLSNRLGSLDGSLRWVVIAAVTACAVAMSPAMFNRLLRLAYGLLKRGQPYDGDYVSGRIIIQASLLYAVSALISGVSLFFVAKAFYEPLGLANLIFVVGVGSLAGALGMLAIFVPSGVGVREGVFLVLLATIMPPENALLVTVASRLWSVVMDLVFFVVNTALYWLRGRRTA